MTAQQEAYVQVGVLERGWACDQAVCACVLCVGVFEELGPLEKPSFL